MDYLRNIFRRNRTERSSILPQYIESVSLLQNDEYEKDPYGYLNYANQNDRNHLMISATNGNTEEVKKLLFIGFDPDSQNAKESAIDLAYENQHYDTVLALLEGNSKFPKKFEIENIKHEGLKGFVEMTKKFHEELEKLNPSIEFLQKNKNDHSNMRYFYGIDAKEFNRSAMYINQKMGNFASQKILDELNLSLAVNEHLWLSKESLSSIDESSENILYSKKKEVITPKKYLKYLSDERISFYGLNTNDLYHKEIEDAYSNLDKIEEISPLLEYVASIGNFKMVFNFENVHCEPTRNIYEINKISPECIYIGAKNLLSENVEKQQDVYGIICKELCLYAVKHLFENSGKPYEANDKKAKSEYKKAVQECMKNQFDLPLINSLYGSRKSKKCLKVELITKVPQIFAQFSNNEDELINCKENFKELLNYYKIHVIENFKNSMENEINMMEAFRLNPNHAVMFQKPKFSKKEIFYGFLFLFSLFLPLVFFTIALEYFKTKGAISAICNCGLVKAKNPSGLIQGLDAKDVFPGQIPWHGALIKRLTKEEKKFLNVSKNEFYICGVTLITQLHLLTAAHCVVNENNTENYFVILGRFNISNDLETNWEKRNISKIFIHNDYSSKRMNAKSKGDIAVLRMSNYVEFTTYIQPICFPNSKTFKEDEIVLAFVAGYGKHNEERLHEETPKYTMVTTKKYTDCVKHNDEEYAKIMAFGSFCAQATESAVPCRGDSGGGLYLKNSRSNQQTIIGIVSQSLNPQECNPKDPVVFVSVVEYRDWIIEKLSDSSNNNTLCLLS
ncbi:hypothetical protein PVAND_017449 [Polypedilum vanderplanki]|uniref:Peptidase S1 domain-containing protein n=1 Tax=Polypedilum vanderplanki TaxID=319348 RepID=A0A9J6BIM0_POLVA|nr:hypothetical protein PVAND_017449 [Polypedilum vanderplanki]